VDSDEDASMDQSSSPAVTPEYSAYISPDEMRDATKRMASLQIAKRVLPGSSGSNGSEKMDERPSDSSSGSFVRRSDATVAGSVEPSGTPSVRGQPKLTDFTMLRVVGKGSFGKVILVRKKHGGDEEKLYAMKVLKKRELVRRRQIQRTKTERLVLGTSSHPFITKLHYAFQNEEKLFMVMDFCAGGELFFHLSRYRRFPERVARFYAAELTLALEHLHSRDVVYRDLKPENVFLQDNGHIKLGDFGLAKAGVKEPAAGAKSMCGTPEYMAPEVLNRVGHGKTVDWWGLGMITYEMLTGLPPWYTRNRQKLFYRLRHAPLKVPTYMSRMSAIFIAQLLNRDASKRLGANGSGEVKDQEFFAYGSIDFEALMTLSMAPPIRPMEPRPSSEQIRNALKDDGASDDGHQGHAEDDLSVQNFDPQFARLALSSSMSVSSDTGSNSRPTTPVVFDDFSFDGSVNAPVGRKRNGSGSSSGSQGFWDADLNGQHEAEVTLKTPRGSINVLVSEDLDPPSDEETESKSDGRTRVKSHREEQEDDPDGEVAEGTQDALLSDAFGEAQDTEEQSMDVRPPLAPQEQSIFGLSWR